jgi:hypothetical protein
MHWLLDTPSVSGIFKGTGEARASGSGRGHVPRARPRAEYRLSTCRHREQ